MFDRIVVLTFTGAALLLIVTHAQGFATAVNGVGSVWIGGIKALGGQ